RERIHANQALDLRIRHERERAVRALRGVVDEPIDRAKILPQLLDEVRYLLHVSEIERHEMERPRTRSLGLFDRRGELIVDLPGDGDRAVAFADEPADDPQTEAPAS